jgi:DNA-binding NarL/FixJ family response regulator
VNAIRRLLTGESPLNQELAMKLLKAITEEAENREITQSNFRRRSTDMNSTLAANPLTPRESEGLRLLTTGKTNRELASDLHLSISTVKSHVEHIIFKLKVSARTQAAVKAAELGLLPAHSDRSRKPGSDNRLAQ